MIDLKRKNMLRIFDSIVEGKRTLSDISEHTNISKITVCELTKALVDNGIIVKSTSKENRVGRRTNEYMLNRLHNCLYIEQAKRFFSCISIGTDGKVVQRIDYGIFFDIPIERTITELMEKIHKSKEFNLYCLAIYVCCEDNVKQYFPKNVIFTNQQSFILEGFSDSNKVLLFNFGNEKVISAYGRLHYPNQEFTMKQLKTVLKVDKSHNFEKGIYYGIFQSIKLHTLMHLKERIGKLC